MSDEEEGPRVNYLTVDEDDADAASSIGLSEEMDPIEVDFEEGDLQIFDLESDADGYESDNEQAGYVAMAVGESFDQSEESGSEEKSPPPEPQVKYKVSFKNPPRPEDYPVKKKSFILRFFCCG